jgi:hypothetical protein
MPHKGNVVVREEYEAEADGGNGLHVSQIVSVAHCAMCDEVVVGRYAWVDEFGEAFSERQLYPTERNNEPLPVKVRQRLDSARKVRTADAGLYAVAVRRLLETVCNEQGAAGRNLIAKLQDLAGKGRIPELLGEMADQLRLLGNIGAHDADVEIDERDVPVIEDFAEAILEYLYRAPAKLAAARAALDRRLVSRD